MYYSAPDNDVQRYAGASMTRMNPDTIAAAGRDGNGVWTSDRRRSYQLAYVVLIGIKILGIAWLLLYAAPALLWGS